MRTAACTGLLALVGALALYSVETTDTVLLYSLDDAVRRALAHDMNLSHLQTEAALARDRADRLARIRRPVLQIALANRQHRIPSRIDLHIVELTTSLAAVLYDGGMRRRSLQGAEAERSILVVQRTVREAQIRGMASELTAAYALASEAAAIALQHAARARREVDSRALDHAAGALTARDLSLVRLSAERAEIEARRREGIREDARAELAALLGLSEGERLILRFTIDLPSEPVPIYTDTQALIARALEVDPGLQALRLRRDIAASALGASSFVPVVQGSAALSMQGAPLPLASPELQFGVSLSWPSIRSGTLSAGGSVALDDARNASRQIGITIGESTRFESRVEARRHVMAAESAVFAYQTERRNVAVGVAQAVRDYSLLVSVLSADRDAIRAAEAHRSQIRSEVASGSRRAIELIDAESALAEARLSERETAFSLARLYRLLQQQTGLTRP